MGDKESEGAALLQEAEDAMNTPVGFFASLFGGSGSGSANAEKAADLYVKAGNCYKLAKNYRQAGMAYSKAAAAHQTASKAAGLGSYEAASKYSDAAKMFRQAGDADRAQAEYRQAVALHSDEGRFQQAAKLSKELAESMETSNELAGAREWYIKAADLFEGEDATTQSGTCRAKAAEIYAMEEDYLTAAELFEKVAEQHLANKLLKFGAKEILLKAGLCRLALGDDIGARRAFDKYCSQDPSFMDSREGKLLSDIIKSKEECDIEGFTTTVFNFDSMTKLDPWKTSLLLRVKNMIRAVEDDLT